jgi:LysR family transcriptional regulator, hydrogen peroxide-inducible genes activator
MELHQLKYFAEVVRTGSFTKAANHCHITQPTLSHQIKKLEDELGEPLLQRRKSGVLPTALGERLFERATNLLAEVRAIEDEAANYSSEVRGELHLGVIPTIAPYLLPSLLTRAREEFPGLRFRISEETTENLLQGMRAGTVDLALLSLPVDGDDLETVELFQDELLVVLPQEHPLAQEGALDIQLLAKEPLLLMKEAHCLTGQSLQVCNFGGFHPQVYIYSSQIETVLALIESGMGISFIPAMARPLIETRKLAFRSLGPKPAFRPIALAWPRQTAVTRAHLRFREICLRIRP